MSIVKNHNRDSAFELLRIVAMLFIVLHHVVVHVYGLRDIDKGIWNGFNYNDFQMTTLFALNSLFVIGVNLFILLSGYFSIRLNWRSFLNLFSICFFYSVIFYCLSPILQGTQFTLAGLFHSFFALSNFGGWFISCYFALMLFSPILNSYFEKADSRKVVHGLIFLSLINLYIGFIMRRDPVNITGYNFANFIYSSFGSS